MLFFFIFISCNAQHKEYADNVFPYSGFPQEKELKGEVIELDTALSLYPFRIRIEGDEAIVIIYSTIIYGIWVDEATKTIVATDVNNDQPILKFSFG